MQSAPYEMLKYFEADEDDELQVIEVQGDEGPWFPCETFFPDATLLVLLYTKQGVRHIAVKHEERIAEFDLNKVIVRDGSPIGVDR